VTWHGGVVAEESVDGRYLYYGKHPDPNKGLEASLWKMPVGGGDENPVAIALAHASMFTPSAAGIYFIAADQKAQGYTLQFRPGQLPSRTLMQIDKELGVGMSVSPQEHWIVYAARDKVAGDFVMLEEFP
jgi:hypothetical protein